MACQCSKRFYYVCFFLSIFITSQKVHQACSWSSHLGRFIEMKWHSRHQVLLLRVPINPSGGRGASLQASLVLGYKNCFSLISSCFSPPTCHCNYKPSTRQPALQRLLLCKRTVTQTTEIVYQMCTGNYSPLSACFSKCYKSDGAGTLQQLKRVCDTLVHYQEA